MKLKDFLQETPNSRPNGNVLSFISGHVNFYLHGSRIRASLVDVTPDGQIICKNSDGVSIFNDAKHSYLKMNIKPEQWVNWEQADFDFHTCSIKDLGAIIPACEAIELHDCIVEKLNFKSSMKTIKAFRIGSSSEIKSGLLSILRLPALEELSDHRFYTQDEDDSQSNAVEIIKKHLESKDIIECQSELIDAGFEKWAKM